MHAPAWLPPVLLSSPALVGLVGTTWRRGDMRLRCKLALAFLLGLASLSWTNDQAAAGAAGITPSVLTTPAHVSSSLTPAYYDHLHLARSRFCYSQHIQCELDAGGRGYYYKRCMRRRGCYPYYGGGYYHGDIYDFRRKGYSCRYWYRRCRENWFYPEDVRGCLRYYGCLHRYY